MAFQAVPDTAEIDVIFTNNSVGLQNSYYAELPGGYLQSNLQALADTVDLVVGTSWLLELPPESNYVRTEVRGLAVENDLTAQQNLSAGPGTNVSATMPNQVTFSIKKTSGLTGRSARGRTYWAAIPSAMVDPADENFLLAVEAAKLVANVEFLRTNLIGLALWNPVLVSRFSGGAQRAIGVTFPWTGTSNVDLRIDTLRGRLP